MASLDLFRVFVAVYRAGSVSAAARERNLTQPAVSAQLGALEARIGEPLFTRTAKGVRPTERGKLLYAQVADAVDRLERAGHDIRLTRTATLPLRLGCPPEFLQGYVLPRLSRAELAGKEAAPGPLLVELGNPQHLGQQVETGALDAALVNTPLQSRALTEQEVTTVPFVLVGPAAWPGVRLPLGELAATLNARPWVSYSVELPTTRRFFTQELGQKFAAPLALVVPDLRAVVRAVEQGLGASIVPLYAAQEAMRAGRIHELYPVGDLIRPEQWRLVYRVQNEDHPEVQKLAQQLRGLGP